MDLLISDVAGIKVKEKEIVTRGKGLIKRLLCQPQPIIQTEKRLYFTTLVIRKKDGTSDTICLSGEKKIKLEK